MESNQTFCAGTLSSSIDSWLAMGVTLSNLVIEWLQHSISLPFNCEPDSISLHGQDKYMSASQHEYLDN